jgi:hypothetical protein
MLTATELARTFFVSWSLILIDAAIQPPMACTFKRESAQGLVMAPVVIAT